MWHHFIYWIFYMFLLELADCCDVGLSPFCGSRNQSCTTQILGNHSDADSCRVEYYDKNSMKCKDMQFNSTSSYPDIGGVSLQPYILQSEYDCNGSNMPLNLTVLKISFSNIKWKNMRFRFQPLSREKNHCRNIVISNDVTVNDQSVLYYNCYWQATTTHSGQSHYFDFEASDGINVNRGTFIFDVPTPQMLDSQAHDWRPFVYIERTSNHLKLHITPPAEHLKVLEYRTELMKENDYDPDELVANLTIKGDNATIKGNAATIEAVYGSDKIPSTGNYYFMVTPVHGRLCSMDIDKCQTVKTTVIPIKLNEGELKICIACIVALVVGVLLCGFSTSLIMYLIRKRWCNEYDNLDPKSPIILVIYNSENRIHATCVYSFVRYLRMQYCFDVRYDGDIANTSDKDPQIWANEAFEAATHIMYIGSPKDETDIHQNIYENPIAAIITPHRNIDNLLLHRLQAYYATSGKNKKIINVLFDHSSGVLPIETKNYKKYHVEKDWNKLYALLTKHVLAKTQISGSEQGKNLIDHLNKASKHFGTHV